MATYNADLQAAVDSTGVALATGETDDLVQYLRDQLAEREIETQDDAWLERMVEGVRNDRNYMIDSEPNDFTAEVARGLASEGDLRGAGPPGLRHDHGLPGGGRPRGRPLGRGRALGAGAHGRCSRSWAGS